MTAALAQAPTPVAPSAPPLADCVKKLNQAVQEVDGELVERTDQIKMLFRGALSRTHVLLFGEGGVAKSMLLDQVSAHLPGHVFKTHFTEKMEPSMLFGPVDLAAMEQGIARYHTTNMLPDCRWAFGEELFDAMAGDLRMLLLILNEREFPNGLTVDKCPLDMFVGATNFEPNDRKLVAFCDRFGARSWVIEIVSDASWETVLDAQLEREAKQSKFLGKVTVLTEDEMAVLQHARANVVVPKDVKKAAIELKNAAKNEGLDFSARRFFEGMKIAQAQTIMRGATTMSKSDLVVFGDVLCNSKDEVATARKLVADYASASTKEARKFRKMFEPYEQELAAIRGRLAGGAPIQSADAAKLFDVGPALKKVIDQVQPAIDKTNANGGDASELVALMAEMESARDFVRVQALGG